MLTDAEKETLLECARFHEDLAIMAKADEQVERHLRMARACRAALKEAK